MQSQFCGISTFNFSIKLIILCINKIDMFTIYMYLLSFVPFSFQLQKKMYTNSEWGDGPVSQEPFNMFYNKNISQ